MKKFLAFLALSVMAMPIAVSAGSFSSKNITVSADETINGNYYAAGEQIIIDGNVNGDVIVAGGIVTVNGAVSGDVIAAGGQVRVTGPVSGDIRLAGGDITVDSVVARNATILGGNVYLTHESAIGSSATVLGGNVEALGSIEHELTTIAGALKIDGKVGKDVWAKVGEEDQFLLLSRARIGGDLRYESVTPAAMISGSEILGEVDFKQFSQKSKDIGKAIMAGLVIGYIALILFSLISLWIIGFLLLWLVPKHVSKVGAVLSKEFWPSFGRGIVLLIVTPIVITLLFMSGFGILVALVLLAIFFLASLCAIVHFSTFMGEFLLKKITGRRWRGVSQRWSMVFGTTLFVVFSALPFIGWALKLFMLSTGFGAWLVVAMKEVKKQQ